MLIGYCRISTENQNLDSQIDQLIDICRKENMATGDIAEMYGAETLKDLTRTQAYSVVNHLEEFKEKLGV